ncbi:MAG: AraC family transcriptional regulator [Lachnospiraceae bacterium]|nr:AraC family transcriptional regulator [Lachnospiraceae bacterium]
MDYEKTGYLTEDYKFFHIKDRSDRVYKFHYHDFYKIILFIKGNVSYNVEGKNYELKPGDLILVGRNEIHRPLVDPDAEYERFVVYLSDTFLSQKVSATLKLIDCFGRASSEHMNVLHLSSHDRTELSGIIGRMEEKEGNTEYGADAEERLLLLEFLIKLNESINKNGISFTGKVAYSETIVSVTEYINSHLGDDLSLDRLSEIFSLSRYHLMRLFKECTGYTIHQYIIEKRILFTKKLTDEGEKIKDACVKAGFKDYTMYLRAKKKHDLK